MRTCFVFLFVVVEYIVKYSESSFVQIDVDVQRNNELLEVARGASKNISEVVARRRKDFTKEFFEHLHTVAESYFDNPVEQNG